MGHADSILEAFSSGALIAPLTDGDPTFDEAAAYAVAAEVHQRRMQRGEHPVGRKIGFTNRTIWELFGVWAPIWGYVYDSTVRHANDGAAVFGVGHLLQPRIEPEIQLHFARTPPVTHDEAAILDCVDWIAHGYEIVQCPYPEWRFKAPDTIAAYALHGGLVVGEHIAVTGADDLVAKLRTFTITLSCDGVERATGGGADVLDSPLCAFAHLTEVLAQQSPSIPVAAGEIITTGTLTNAMPIQVGETWSTNLKGIELPNLAITFT